MSAANAMLQRPRSASDLEDEILESFKVLVENVNAVYEAAEQALRLVRDPMLVEPVVQAHIRASAARDAFQVEMQHLAELVDAVVRARKARVLP